MVRISRSHRDGRGSIPRLGMFSTFLFKTVDQEYHKALDFQCKKKTKTERYSLLNGLRRCDAANEGQEIEEMNRTMCLKSNIIRAVTCFFHDAMN